VLSVRFLDQYFSIRPLPLITFSFFQGFLNAAKLSSAASGQPLSSHRILFLGAGSAGVGVAMQLQSFFTLNGLSADEARERIWLFDSQGLVYDARGPMAEHKKRLFRHLCCTHGMTECSL